MQFHNFPEVLRNKRQWVMWKKEMRNGKLTKVPYQTNGQHAGSTLPDTWGTFEECLSFLGEYDGIGYVFAGEEVGIDLDHCFQEDGTLTPFAEATLARFSSYTEKSPSGAGLHIIISSDAGIRGRKLPHVECYTSGRFFTVTGDVFRGRTELADCDILEWYRDTFPEKEVLPATTEGARLPDDATILRAMFRSKNGEKTRRLYNVGDWSAIGYGSQSEADLALAGTLMFFCGNDEVVADRLFRESRLFRQKWDEKHGGKTYGAQTLERARKAEVMEWKEQDIWKGDGEEFLMSGGKEPVPMVILENICRVMERDSELCGRFRMNDFSHMIEVLRDGVWDNLQEQDILDTQRYISTSKPCFARVSKEMVLDAIRVTANLTHVNPPRDFLCGLTWDGVGRLDGWITKVYGTPDDDLHAKIGANWMKGLVKRVIEPGCQFDEVLVLEGDQGFRKSTSLRVLAAPWHVESTLSTEDKDFYMLLARNVVVEFSEGDIVGRTSARKLKGIITKTEDSFRPPYERGLMTFKRGCVFAMTTNDADYQKDETGGRRWLPVVLTRPADIDWLKANREQLFAEAYHRAITARETTHEYPAGELAVLQGSKVEYDEIADPIIDWYAGLPSIVKEGGVLTLDAYNGALVVKNMFTTVDEEKKLPRDMMWRIARVFKVNLGLENKALRVNGVLRKRWFKKGE